jgi:transcriptional regulator with XRE-family HTH domain
MDLPAMLGTELARRRARNPRYSLRAFARALGTHHSTLSQILHRRRRLTARAIEQLGARLGLSTSEIREARREENCTTVLSLTSDPRFRADSRWIAMMAGIPLDDVNVALHWLLHSRRLVMRSRTTWAPGAPS